VVPSPNGERLFAVQGTIGDPAASRVAVETRTASEQSMALSSGAVQGAPNVLHQQQDAQQEQARRHRRPWASEPAAPCRREGRAMRGLSLSAS
jgi:hypothetical protein